MKAKNAQWYTDEASSAQHQHSLVGAQLQALHASYHVLVLILPVRSGDAKRV